MLYLKFQVSEVMLNKLLAMIESFFVCQSCIIKCWKHVCRMLFKCMLRASLETRLSGGGGARGKREPGTH